MASGSNDKGLVRSRRAAWSVLCVLICAGVLALQAVGASAGSIRNDDDREYTVTLHWEDLSPPETFTLESGGERRFEDKRVTVELVGKKDNMYVWPRELVVVRNGVMRRVSEEEGEGSGH